MWGTETLTTVVSRISMNVASMTAAVTIHGIHVRGLGGGHAEIQPVMIETRQERGSDVAHKASD
jgi:hypothetical protein